MQSRSIIFLIFLLCPFLVNAASNLSNYGLDTLDGIKKYFTILDSSPFGKGTWYSLDNPYFVAVWCDADDIVQGQVYRKIRNSFKGIIKGIIDYGGYELLGRVPTDVSYLKRNVRLKAKDHDILVIADKDVRFKTIYYMNSEFRDLLIAEKAIPYFR